MVWGLQVACSPAKYRAETCPRQKGQKNGTRKGSDWGSGRDGRRKRGQRVREGGQKKI